MYKKLNLYLSYTFVKMVTANIIELSICVFRSFLTTLTSLCLLKGNRMMFLLLDGIDFPSIIDPNPNNFDTYIP